MERLRLIWARGRHTVPGGARARGWVEKALFDVRLPDARLVEPQHRRAAVGGLEGVRPAVERAPLGVDVVLRQRKRRRHVAS
eukprot:7381460-Prymnesium_polylepis.1